MFPQKSFVLSSPRGKTMKEHVKKIAGKGGVLISLALLLLSAAAPAAAQKKDKQKQAPKTESSHDAPAMLQLPDTQATDQPVGQSLGYWHNGDVHSFQKYDGDDVV